jgi:hypothetical protein
VSLPVEQLVRRWGHSFEEDHDGVLVYRPADFDFPRARGRAGLEFRADGGFVDWQVGAGDARQPHPGTWRLDGEGRLTLAAAGGERGARERVLQVQVLTPDLLELRPTGE